MLHILSCTAVLPAPASEMREIARLLEREDLILAEEIDTAEAAETLVPSFTGTRIAMVCAEALRRVAG
jgi:hypothetical protein